MAYVVVFLAYNLLSIGVSSSHWGLLNIGKNLERFRRFVALYRPIGYFDSICWSMCLILFSYNARRWPARLKHRSLSTDCGKFNWEVQSYMSSTYSSKPEVLSHNKMATDVICTTPTKRHNSANHGQILIKRAQYKTSNRKYHEKTRWLPMPIYYNESP